MTNIVVNGRGTLVDSRSADEVASLINNAPIAGLRFIRLEPSGVWVNPLHIVSISDVE